MFTFMRLPLVITNALFLVLLATLLARLFTPTHAAAAVSGIALSPLIIGMSRIINPDALTWSIMSIALIAGIGAFCERTRMWTLIADIFLGLAFLTKYIAVIFLPVFAIFAFLTPSLYTHNNTQRAPVWQLFMNDRPDNFVKIIPVHTKN